MVILQEHTFPVRALAVLFDGTLVSGSRDNTIKLWNPNTYICFATLQGHSESVETLVVLPGNVLASGSQDTTVKLWDLITHTCLATLQGHKRPVNALAVLPNSTLVSGSGDATLKLWDVDAAALRLQQKAEQKAAQVAKLKAELAMKADKEKVPAAAKDQQPIAQLIKLWDTDSAKRPTALPVVNFLRSEAKNLQPAAASSNSSSSSSSNSSASSAMSAAEYQSNLAPSPSPK